MSASTPAAAPPTIRIESQQEQAAQPLDADQALPSTDNTTDVQPRHSADHVDTTSDTHDEPHQDPQPADANDPDQMIYPSPSFTQPLIHPPNFKPFFTLVEDSSASSTSNINEHHIHPTVHYIFSDDDPDLLTAAALQTLSPDHDISHRFVILDLDADGQRVEHTSSMSPEWQAVKTEMNPAPSWGRAEDGSSGAERGLMLRISGREINVDGGGKERRRRRGDMEGLLRALDEHMHELEDVFGDNEGDIGI